jgi:hypothetical protein
MQGEASAESVIRPLTTNKEIHFKCFTNEQAVEMIEKASMDLQGISLYFYGLDSLSSDKITKTGNIFAITATRLSFPNLTESRHILTYVAAELNLPKLVESGEIYANSAIVIYGRPEIQDKLRNTKIGCVKKRGIV